MYIPDWIREDYTKWLKVVSHPGMKLEEIPINTYEFVGKFTRPSFAESPGTTFFLKNSKGLVFPVYGEKGNEAWGKWLVYNEKEDPKFFCHGSHFGKPYCLLRDFFTNSVGAKDVCGILDKLSSIDCICREKREEEEEEEEGEKEEEE